MRWSNRLERYVESFVGDDGDRSLIDYDQELHDDDHVAVSVAVQASTRVRAYAESLRLTWDESWDDAELAEHRRAMRLLSECAARQCHVIDIVRGRVTRPLFVSDDDIHHAGPPLHSDRFLVGDDG